MTGFKVILKSKDAMETTPFLFRRILDSEGRQLRGKRNFKLTNFIVHTPLFVIILSKVDKIDVLSKTWGN